MAGAKMGLGGGLSNLFGSDTSDLMEESLDNGTKHLPLAKIEPNPDQPRKVFDQVSLDELAESIRLHGVITPITVRKGEKDGYYQIIAGERRWRAARQAGLEDIPAMVLEAEEDEVMELALIENLQRQDLNPIEEAEGYERLMKQFGFHFKQEGKGGSQSFPDGSALFQYRVLIQIAHTDIFGPFHFAFIRHKLSGDNIHKGRFPLAVGADQANMLSLEQAEGNIMKNGSVSKAMGKMFNI